MTAALSLHRGPRTSAVLVGSVRLIALSVVLALRLPAQAAGGVQKPDTMHKMAGMPGMGSDSMPAMAMTLMPLGIPMQRIGSGTTWLPDSSPMHAHHMLAGPWELMLHGQAFGVYDKQNGPRGSEQFSSINGPAFYNLPRNTGSITLARHEWTLPLEITAGESTLVPLNAGETMGWKLV